MTSHSLVNKQLQYTYCPISPEVKAIGIFFLKNYSENEAGRLGPDLSLSLYE